jgi:hypothetical protein
MAYELDRDPATEPSLLDMVKIALATIEEESKMGQGRSPSMLIRMPTSRCPYSIVHGLTM